MRLASERRRLEGLTLSGQTVPQRHADALATLRTLIAALPDDLALDLEEVRIEGSAVTLRGRTRDHRQAERISAALDSIADLECPAPPHRSPPRWRRAVLRQRAPQRSSDSLAGGPAMSDTSAQHEPPAVSGSRRVQRQARMLTIACLAAAVVCALLWGSMRSRSAALHLQQGRAAELAADAGAIARLRQRPQQATETGLPPSELLGQVSAAMQAADLDPASLLSTLPQPPRQLPGSQHAELTHRLTFTNITLPALVRFCHTLTTDNPQLSVSTLQLRATDQIHWSSDICVSYWTIQPARQ